MPYYSPTIKELVELTADDWGDRETNIRNTIFYRIAHVDEALHGIDMQSGEMIGIQATKKQRKSTLLLNLILGFASQLRDKSFWVCADTLESGMPPSAYRDSLLAIASTRILISRFYGNDTSKWPSYSEMMANQELSKQLNISRDFFRYGNRTPLQHECIETAKAAVSGLPVSIFGPSKVMGQTRDIEASVKRWDDLYYGRYVVKPYALNERGIDMTGLEHRVFTCDHISQAGKFGQDHYSRQEIIVEKHAEFVVTHPGSVVIDVAQIGSSSSAGEKKGYGDAHAKGGLALAAEVTVLFRTIYDKDESPHQMKIIVQDTRKRPPPPVIQEIEPSSGAFLGSARADVRGRAL